MNRPLQVQAYLESLYMHLPAELIQSYLLYKFDQFSDQYNQVFDKLNECIVIKEKNFHDDFVNLIESIDTKYILFATDDVAYFDSVDFDVIDKTFDIAGDDIFGFSLRLDPENTNDDCVTKTEVNNQKILALNWKNGKTPNSRYPFELNSTIYRTELVKKIITAISKQRPRLKKVLRKESLLSRTLGNIVSLKRFRIAADTFYNPNTLEGFAYKWCRDHKQKLPNSVYFQKICASAIQINIVNTSTDNPIDGTDEHTVKALNEKFKQGYRFDHDAFERNKPRTTHVGRECFQLIRQE